MADISKITLPSGTTYNIKDETARQAIADLNNYTAYLGVTTTTLTDGATTNPITVNDSSVTAVSGNIVNYSSKEFIFNGTAWQEFGDLSALATVATSGSYNDLTDTPTIPDISTKMDKADPTGTGSLSINRQSNSTIGDYSTALGYNCTASGNFSHAEGYSTTASGISSHAEGESATASGNYSHAEGSDTTASGDHSHAEGEATTASGDYSHAEGYSTTASGRFSHAEGRNTTASGDYSHASGVYTLASSDYQTVIGKFNTEDKSSEYAFIVGNGTGTGTSSRSNAFAVDWDGNIVSSQMTSLQTNISAKANTADLGDLATKDSASGSFTPSGSVSAPTITVTPSTTSVYSITAVGSLPSATMPVFSATVSSENLTLGWTDGTFDAGSLPTKGSATSVMTGATATSSQPAFTGTSGTVTVS